MLHHAQILVYINNVLFLFVNSSHFIDDLACLCIFQCIYAVKIVAAGHLILLFTGVKIQVSFKIFTGKPSYGFLCVLKFPFCGHRLQFLFLAS